MRSCDQPKGSLASFLLKEDRTCYLFVNLAAGDIYIGTAVGRTDAGMVHVPVDAQALPPAADVHVG